MTHARTNHIAAGILALALTIALALSTTHRPGVSQDVQLQLRRARWSNSHCRPSSRAP